MRLQLGPTDAYHEHKEKTYPPRPNDPRFGPEDFLDTPRDREEATKGLALQGGVFSDEYSRVTKTLRHS